MKGLHTAILLIILTLIGCDSTIVAPNDNPQEVEKVSYEPVLDEPAIQDLILDEFMTSKNVPNHAQKMSKSSDLFARVVHAGTIMKMDGAVSGYLFRIYNGEDIIVPEGLLRVTTDKDGDVIGRRLSWRPSDDKEFDFMYRTVEVRSSVPDAVIFFDIEDDDGSIVLLRGIQKSVTYMRLPNVVMTAHAESDNRFLSDEVTVDRGDTGISFSFTADVGEVEEVLVLEWDEISAYLDNAGYNADKIMVYHGRVYDDEGTIANIEHVFLSTEHPETRIGLPSEPARAHTSITLYANGFRVGYVSINWTAAPGKDEHTWVLKDPTEKG